MLIWLIFSFVTFLGMRSFSVILISGCHTNRELFESDSTVIFLWFISGAACCRSAGSMQTFSHCHLLVQSWIFMINSYMNKILENWVCYPTQNLSCLNITSNIWRIFNKGNDIFLSGTLKKFSFFLFCISDELTLLWIYYVLFVYACKSIIQIK
jgi:hypothetical protein